MHDGWKSYDAYTNCRHVLCNAHLLRDLQGIIDSTGQKWSKSIWLPSCIAIPEKDGKISPASIASFPRF
ncbi:IS66 family transposase [Escherichia sp. HC-CC]